VDDLTEAMREVEARRQRLREKLETQTDGGGDALDSIPGLVQGAMADLRIMLEGGQTPVVRRAVSRMISRIEVKGAAVPERKLLEPRLYLRGNLPGLLALAAERSAELGAGAGFVVDERTRTRRWIVEIAFRTPQKLLGTISRMRRLGSAEAK
jgi:hypothetical protein